MAVPIQRSEAVTGEDGKAWIFGKVGIDFGFSAENEFRPAHVLNRFREGTLPAQSNWSINARLHRGIPRSFVI